MKRLKEVWKLLKGKKTFIVAGLMVVLSGLKAQGYLSEGGYEVILTILGGLGLATLRMGMKK